MLRGAAPRRPGWPGAPGSGRLRAPVPRTLTGHEGGGAGARVVGAARAWMVQLRQPKATSLKQKEGARKDGTRRGGHHARAVRAVLGLHVGSNLSQAARHCVTLPPNPARPLLFLLNYSLNLGGLRTLDRLTCLAGIRAGRPGSDAGPGDRTGGTNAWACAAPC